MTMLEKKNFLNFHVLISHSPSCLNRDDQNMQKRAVFGGVERIRISSQSLKRAMRRPPENAPNYWLNCGVLGDPSTRTRSMVKIEKYLIEELKKEFENEEIIKQAIQMFVSSTKKQDEENDEDNGIKENSSGPKNNPVAPWAKAEIYEICKIIETVKNNGLTDEEKKKALAKVGKAIGKKDNKRVLTEQDCINEAVMKKIINEINNSTEKIKQATGTAVDIALWGRMATSGLMTPVDGALAVAHAITTHAAQADTDWFTAVDDLVQDSGEVGAGHLDTQEFSSGVFYRYASLNISQLQKNLGNATRERALEIAKHVFHMLCTVVPTAKQQSFAAHNYADFAIVTFDDQPISLANAFEKPITKGKNGGFLNPSVSALVGYCAHMEKVYGLNGITVGTPQGGDADMGSLKMLPSFPDVEKWICNDGIAE